MIAHTPITVYIPLLSEEDLLPIKLFDIEGKIMNIEITGKKIMAEMIGKKISLDATANKFE